jgi:hypothetical protein
MSSMKRLYGWILFGPSNPVVYGIAAVAGALPLLLSFLDNSFHDAHRLVAGTELTFKGLNASRNWWIFTVCLPLALWLLRLSVRFVVGDSPHAEPPLAQLTEERGSQTERIRAALLDGRTPLAVLFLIVIIACFDMANVVPSYLYRTIPKEPDWTTMFLAHAMRARYDAVHVAIAYAVQYATGFLALLAFGIFLVHNLIYLKLIYQRRRAASPAAFW